MQDLARMNHFGGNMNRGFGGPPQPQRPNNRRNRGGGGGQGGGQAGPGGFRNSRFEHNQQNNRQQNQNSRPNEASAKADIVDQGNKGSQQATPPVKSVNTPESVQKTSASQQGGQVQAAQNTKDSSENPKPTNQQANVNQAPPTNQGQGTNQNQANSANDTRNSMNFGNEKKKGFSGAANKQGGIFGGQNKQGGFQGQGGNFQGQGGNRGGGGGQQNGPPRNQRQGQRGPGEKNNFPPGLREEHMLAAKLKDFVGPMIDLPPLEQGEVKFNGRSRLYIGNLSNDITEDEIKEMFGAFGETSELFLNKEKNFAFIRLDYRANAEKAKHELDGSVKKGRPLRVRFAPHNSAIRVRNLTGFVSNELLYRAFEIFGKIERAYIKVDERGKTLNEGVVEFARKPCALAALRNCTEKCFFLTSSLRPVIVESFEEPDEFDGYPEKNLPKKHPDYLRARELGPRFSELNSFEHEYGTRWKQLHELYKQKEEALKAERSSEEDKLEAQMEYAKYEHETELLREQLRMREQDRERQKRSWEQAERAAEERREADRLSLSRHEQDLSARMRQQDDDLRRRQQENTLFIQAQRLNNMLDRQEQGMFDSQPQTMDGGFMDQFQERGRGYDDMRGPSQAWEGGRLQDDFPNKRRRF